MADLIIFPDAVAAACAHLRSELGGTVVVSDVPTVRPVEFVSVERVGGVARNLVVDEASLVVDCWAARKQDAHDLAQRCRALLHAAVGTTLSGVMVYRCDELGGPANLPDPLSSQPRYSFSVALAVRGIVEVAS
jgi:acetylornithine deacetylase/succinyl-diaminopimelate desuccinylase-like protein